MKQKGPGYDQGLAALVEDLHERGLDKDVTVVVLRDGETAPDFKGATLAIVHKNVPRELLRYARRRANPNPQVYGPGRVAALSKLLRRHCGPPIHDDPYLQVFRIPQ